jgi:hypothetical protein
MIALAQYGRFGFIALAMFVRWLVAKLDHFENGSGVWVTGRTGNVTVVTDRLY